MNKKVLFILLMVLAGMLQLCNDVHAKSQSQLDNEMVDVLHCMAESFPNRMTTTEYDAAWYACGGWDVDGDEYVYDVYEERLYDSD